MTAKTRATRRRKTKRHIVPIAVATFACMLIAVSGLFAMSAVRVSDSWLSDLPAYQDADAYAVAEPTQVYDAKGNVIASFYLQNRRSVTYDQISDYVKQATVDTEDIRFYEHDGVDAKGIIRAAMSQLTGDSQGASTITQQLVRNTVLSDEQFEHSLKRKVREAYIATQLEKSYSKDQILGMYLNTIYYGHDAYGIEAASITYFNKHASELTLSEASLLSGLPQSPSFYDPFSNLEAATNRRNAVLGRMVVAGDITQAEADAAMAEPVELHEGTLGNDLVGTYPYFTDYIREELLANYDMSTIFQGGLRIYTTIDPDQQKAAEEAVAEVMDDIGDADLEAGLVAVDPNNGHLLAMVGGRDYNKNQFNLTTQAKRQVGSSFKPITLATAINEGVDPQIIVDCSSKYEVDSNWTVHNVGNVNMGKISIADATALSSNTGYVQIEEEIGYKKVQETARKMGMSDDSLPSDLTLTLGTGGAPAIDMAEAYGTFATGGIHHEVSSITRIENPNGTVLFSEDTTGERVLSPEVGAATTEVLETVIDKPDGTGHVIKNMTSGVIDQPIAGKTGTTENTRDLWFCGYTPQVSCAVWVGYREEREILIDGSEGHPSDTACPIFAEFVNKTLADVDRKEFPTASKPEYKDAKKWKFSLGKASVATIDEDSERKKEEEEKAKALAEEEAKRKAESEAKSAEEAKKAEEEAKRKAEEKARQAEEEAAKKAEEEATKKKKEEEESSKKKEEEEEPKTPEQPETPSTPSTPSEGGGESSTNTDGQH